MEQIIIYHNPRCSTSRKALELLQNKGLTPKIIEYLKTPLNLEQLKALAAQFDIKEFVRINEPAFKNLGLSLDNELSVLQAMSKEPTLMQRPIVIFKNKAIIGRPPEKVLDLIFLRE